MAKSGEVQEGGISRLMGVIRTFTESGRFRVRKYSSAIFNREYKSSNMHIEMPITVIMK